MENESRPTYHADILVVDDTRDNLRLLTKLLIENGYYARPVSDGKKAIMAVRDQLPDLILLDIMMPGMDGYEVCEILKKDERTREVPVLFISALNETFDKVKAFSSGGVDYIAKPFQDEEVLARIKTHLNLRAARQQLEEKNIILREANYQLRQRQNTIIRLLGDISKIRLSGDVHAVRNLAQQVSENQKTMIFRHMAGQVAGFHERCRGDGENTEFIAEACRMFGIDPSIIEVPEKIADRLRNIDFEMKKNAHGNALPNASQGALRPNDMASFSDLFSDIISLDDAHDRLVELKNTSKASVAKHFDPFELFFPLRHLQEFIAQINQHFRRYKSMEFVEPIRLSSAIESALNQAVKDKGKNIRIQQDLAYDPVLRTNSDAISCVLRDLIYNAIDAEASTIMVSAKRPSEEDELPFAGQWAFGDYPSLYLRFEDNGNGLDNALAGRINNYLSGSSDDESVLTTKGKDRGGLGTKTLRDFLFLHKGYCRYQSSDAGGCVHMYLEKLEI